MMFISVIVIIIFIMILGMKKYVINRIIVKVILIVCKVVDKI